MAKIFSNSRKRRPLDSLPDIVERAKKSIVKVYHASGQGTGLIVDPKGLVVTNRHVVGLQSYVDISDAADRTECGQVVLSDADVDYAFVLTAPWDVEPLKFREMSGVREGETVVAIGHPLGYSYTVSKGIVSSKGRRYRNIDYLQTDAPINPGNSGGPLLNEQGEVIGINTWIRSDAQGVGFAFPIDYVKRAMARLNVDFSAIGKGYYCNLCGFLNFRFLETPARKYCTNCGAAVIFKERPAPQPTHTVTVPPDATTPVSELACTCCKTVNPGSQKYCQHCGATLKKT